MRPLHASFLVSSIWVLTSLSGLVACSGSPLAGPRAANAYVLVQPGEGETLIVGSRDGSVVGTVALPASSEAPPAFDHVVYAMHGRELRGTSVSQPKQSFVLWKYGFDSEVRVVGVDAHRVYLEAETSPVRLVAIDRETGAESWSLELDDVLESGLSLVGDLLAANIDGELVVADVVQGKELWRRSDIEIEGAAAVTATHVLAVSDDDEVIAFDRSSGATLWSFKIEPGFCSRKLPPVMGDGERVFVATEDGMLAVAVADRRPLWTKDVHVSGVAEGTVVGYRGDKVVGIDAGTGVEKWSATLRGKASGEAAFTGETVWVRTESELVGMGLRDGRVAVRVSLGSAD